MKLDFVGLVPSRDQRVYPLPNGEDQRSSSGQLFVLAALRTGRDRIHFNKIAKEEDWAVRFVDSLGEAMDIAATHCTPVLLVERELLGSDWEGDLRRLLSPPWRLVVLLVSAEAEETFWEAVIRNGGYDVLTRPFRDQIVKEAVNCAWLFWKRCCAFLDEV